MKLGDIFIEDIENILPKMLETYLANMPESSSYYNVAGLALFKFETLVVLLILRLLGMLVMLVMLVMLAMFVRLLLVKFVLFVLFVELMLLEFKIFEVFRLIFAVAFTVVFKMGLFIITFTIIDLG